MVSRMKKQAYNQGIIVKSSELLTEVQDYKIIIIINYSTVFISVYFQSIAEVILRHVCLYYHGEKPRYVSHNLVKNVDQQLNFLSVNLYFVLHVY